MKVLVTGAGGFVGRYLLEALLKENYTIAALSTNSMYWTSNDVDYYMVSDDLSISEMVFIATSLNNSKKVSSMK